METWSLALAGGLASGVLVWLSFPLPLLAWAALAPLGLVLLDAHAGAAAVAGALTGAVAGARSVSRPEFHFLLPAAVIPTALAGAAAGAAASLLVSRFGPGALALALPLVAVFMATPLRALGAPRWVSNPLACTQERFLPVVHLARFGNDLTVAFVLGLSAAALALLGGGAASLAVVPALVAVVALGAGAVAHARARNRPRPETTLRVAAVVADGAPPPGRLLGGWPLESDEYADVEATARRYDPLVSRAAEQGAALIVLPEACVRVDETTLPRWEEIVARWAAAHGAVVVAPYFDVSAPANTLMTVGPSGPLFTYDKRHPAKDLEPPKRRDTPPGPHVVACGAAHFRISTVICVDFDYDDARPTTRNPGGLFVVPANDWGDGFDELHHRTSVWSVVRNALTTIRATGHGISAVFDGSGRVLASASSSDGPVVLVVEVPVEHLG